jgi:hypothetical protein
MEHGLGGIKLGNRWEGTTSITGKEYDVAGMIRRQAGNLSVLNVLDGVSTETS